MECVFVTALSAYSLCFISLPNVHVAISILLTNTVTVVNKIARVTPLQTSVFYANPTEWVLNTLAPNSHLLRLLKVHIFSSSVCSNTFARKRRSAWAALLLLIRNRSWLRQERPQGRMAGVLLAPSWRALQLLLDKLHNIANHLDMICNLSLIHIWRCRRSTLCRSRWSPYH